MIHASEGHIPSMPMNCLPFGQPLKEPPLLLPGCLGPTAVTHWSLPAVSLSLFVLSVPLAPCARFKVAQLVAVGATAVPIAIWTQGVRLRGTSAGITAEQHCSALKGKYLRAVACPLPSGHTHRLLCPGTYTTALCALALIPLRCVPWHPYRRSAWQGHLAPLDLAVIGAVIGGAAVASSALWYYSSRCAPWLHSGPFQR